VRLDKLERQTFGTPGACPGCGGRDGDVQVIVIECPQMGLTKHPPIPADVPRCDVCGCPRHVVTLYATQEDATP
jgi:hypothetical protein